MTKMSVMMSDQCVSMQVSQVSQGLISVTFAKLCYSSI